jgi:hypothetical protein
MRCYHKPTTVVKCFFKKTTTQLTQNVGKDALHLQCSFIIGRRKVWRLLIKLSRHSPSIPAVPISVIAKAEISPGIHQWENEDITCIIPNMVVYHPLRNKQKQTIDTFNVNELKKKYIILKKKKKLTTKSTYFRIPRRWNSGIGTANL